MIKLFKSLDTKMVYVGDFSQGFSEDFNYIREGDLFSIVRVNSGTVEISKANYTSLQDKDGNTFSTAEDLETYLQGQLILDVMLSDSEASGSFMQPYLIDLFNSIVDINSTVDLHIIGDNFNEQTIFSFDNPTVTLNSTNIVSTTEAFLNVTIGNTEVITRITASNGSSNSFGDVFLEIKDLTILIPGSVETPWTNVTNNTTVGLGTISGSSNNGWNKQGVFGSIPSNTDGALFFDFAGTSTNSYGMFGLTSDPTANSNYNTIDYAIYISNGSSVNIYENGSSRGNYGSCSVGDTFEIKRMGNIITYYRNNNLFYTSTINSSSELFFDCSIYRNSSLSSIKIIY